jgi:hypothetical protein
MPAVATIGGRLIWLDRRQGQRDAVCAGVLQHLYEIDRLVAVVNDWLGSGAQGHGSACG